MLPKRDNRRAKMVQNGSLKGPLRVPWAPLERPWDPLGAARARYLIFAGFLFTFWLTFRAKMETKADKNDVRNRDEKHH